MEEKIVINRLLDKYEKSQHLLKPQLSNRRVMLRVEKNELPEYDYENAEVKNKFNSAAENLKKYGFVSIEWIKGINRIDKLILNIDSVEQAYDFVGRKHPFKETEEFCKIIESGLENVETEWIINWRNSICNNMRKTLKIDNECKKGKDFVIKLVKAFSEYDLLNDDITMRAFSSKCYGNTKTFENEIRDSFLKIASKYDEIFQNTCAENNLSVKDKLAYFGIYTRPEIYEFSGNISLVTEDGQLDFSVLKNSGASIRSTTVPLIKAFDMSHINKVIFIENKTNYDEYISSQSGDSILFIYHGGFLSPQKRKFISKIFESSEENTKFEFWADIDLGGFEMFYKLKEIISLLKPLNMSAEDVCKYHMYGLVRNEKYLHKLEKLKINNKYPVFNDVIDMILKYGVTIEQESFLFN